jgi:hypothetical protein
VRTRTRSQRARLCRAHCRAALERRPEEALALRSDQRGSLSDGAEMDGARGTGAHERALGFS